MVFKKNLRAPKVGGSPKGQVHKHAGKGASATSMPLRHDLQQLNRNPAANTMNDYAKASPVSQPAGDPGDVGLGSGDWAGNGI